MHVKNTKIFLNSMIYFAWNYHNLLFNNK
jgi:hypothetical protein